MEVVLYSLPTPCPRCKMLESKLNAKNIPFTLVQSIEALEEMGFETAPALKVDGEVLNFAKAVKWVNKQEVKDE